MSERDDEKTRPTHRVFFARVRETDRDGNQQLGPPREIGAVWPRRNREDGGILRFDHVPREMEREGGGVILIKEFKERGPRRGRTRGERGQDQDRDHERD